MTRNDGDGGVYSLERLGLRIGGDEGVPEKRRR